MKSPTIGLCSPDQKRFLLAELGKLNRSRWDYKRDDPPPFIAVLQRQAAAISKRLGKWERAQDAARKRRELMWSRKLAAARKEIYFGSPAKALEMVEQLQKEYKGEE